MITIETIKGQKRLVVWHTDKIMGHSLRCRLDNGLLVMFKGDHIATALPPLPRHPKNDEATVRLLSLYRAHGIEVWGVVHNPNWRLPPSVKGMEVLPNKDCDFVTEITHATYNGEKIELVFEGDE